MVKKTNEHTAKMIGSQQTHFPEGQFVVEYEGVLVGYCATFRIDEATALAPHTWMQITGGGMASRHKPDGNWLYGMEVVVEGKRRDPTLSFQLSNDFEMIGLLPAYVP